MSTPNIGRDFSRTGIGHFPTAAAYRHFEQVYRQGMAVLPEPRRTVDVPTGWGTVRAYLFGDAPGTPILLLPGRDSSTPLWASNIPGLLEHRSVWALDLLGEPGLSVQTRPITTSVDQAGWLAEAVRGLGVDTVHVLGVSIGGWSAVNLAIHEPTVVASVTAVDPVQTFSRISAKLAVVSLGSVIPFLPDAIRTRLLGYISGGARVTDDVLEGRLVAASMKDFRSSLPVPTRPSDDQLRGITAPTLVILAGRSIVHDATVAAEAARAVLTAGTAEVWPDASHALNGEYPAELSDRVGTFVDSVDRRPPAGTDRINRHRS